MARRFCLVVLIWVSVMVSMPCASYASDALGPNQKLTANQYLTSPNGLAVLYMGADGNLVLYFVYGSQWLPQWATHTEGNAGAYAEMQASDGNFVVYGPGGNALWASHTVGAPNSFVAVQNDGNLVIYDPQSQARWATYTFYQPGLGPNQVLTANQYLTSPNGLVMLNMQDDGNLVLYFRYGSQWVAQWATHTEGNAGAYAEMQASDGNFVVYGPQGNVLWASDTAGVANCVLIVQNDGNLVIYGPQGQVRWATYTFYIPGLGPNQELTANQYMASPNGLAQLYMQDDGNLVLYFRYGSQWLAQWATGTQGNPGAYAVMQASDGNFVVYGPQGNVLWASNTAGVANCVIAVQDDGNVVIYDPQGHARWATWTAYMPGLGPNQTLIAGQDLTSPNGLTRLCMQDDGNLVLYFLYGSQWVPQWTSGTQGNPGAYAEMQASDGNFVVYGPQGNALWASNTAGVPNCVVVVQNDGNLVVYDPQGHARWASNTCRWGAGTEAGTSYPTADDWVSTTWYRHRGQLHAHYMPDGEYVLVGGVPVGVALGPIPAAGLLMSAARAGVTALYGIHGYDFVALTEHQPDWKFDDYTWDKRFEDASVGSVLSLVGSAEDTADTHILGIGFGTGTDPARMGPGLGEETRLANITGNGGLAFAAHPDMAAYRWSDAKLADCAGDYQGLELYNTAAYYMALILHCGCGAAALDQGYAVDTWDELLHSGYRTWGIAGDDYTPNIYQGWTWIDDACVVVWTDAPTPDVTKIKDALRAGRFYATKGGSSAPEILAYWADPSTRTITVQMPQPYRVTFVSGRWWLAPANVTPTNRGDGTYVASYTYSPDDVYVRTEVRDDRSNTSWLQPIWLDQIQHKTGVVSSSSASGLHAATLEPLVLEMEGTTLAVSSPQAGVTYVSGDLLSGEARPLAPTGGYLSRCYQFTPDVALQGANMLSIRYFPDSVRGFPAANLAIYRWDAAAGAWGRLVTTLDESNGEVAAAISQLGIYTVSAESPTDTGIPTIAITSPSDGAQITAPAAITADATDDQGVARVRFYLDGWPISTDNWGGDGFAATLDPANYTVGTKTISAIAEDGVGNQEQAESTVEVAGLMLAPVMTIAAPVQSEVVWGDLSASGEWTGQLPMTLGVFTLDDQPLTATPPTDGSWEISVAMTSEQAGNRTLQATGFDIYGNRAEATVPVMVKVFSDVPLDFWARDQIYGAARANIVEGYPDGTYGPSQAVTRDQMAVYISRALAGGEANVPPGPATATFSDVPADLWAFKYVEYCYAHGVVEGYDPTTYAPDGVVDRAQMAVYVARAVASEDSGVPDGPATATFNDVPTDYWAYKYVEYCKANGIVQGYDPVTYAPDVEVTRDQMAVYVARAFQLPL